MIKKDAKSIWGEYQRGRTYKSSVDLYENYKKNENFFTGNQWEGVNAPDLDKPVINVLKRVVSYFISQIVTDDVGTNLTSFDSAKEIDCKILSKELEKAIEQSKLKAKFRQSVRNAAVDADTFLYFYFDAEADSGQMVKGLIKAELLENLNVFPGNTRSRDIQSQPYIIVSRAIPLDQAREMAKKYGVTEGEMSQIQPDGGELDDHDDNNLVTILTKFWKEDGNVWCQVSTEDLILRKAWNLEYSLYPIAGWTWDEKKNSFHGVAAITGLIPNQIAINKLFAMAIRHVQMFAFPKVIFDKTKMPKYSNKVGQAIGVVGDPNQAVATGFRPPDMSNQVIQTIDKIIEYTMQFMGASDAALGNVRPENTSAIIATQKASAAPLEIQRMAYYEFVEDAVRIMIDIMRQDYGIREVSHPELGSGVIDFSGFNQAGMNLNIDIGASSYWNEANQIATMDNLFSHGIITDAVMYLEGIPDKYIKNKSKLIEQLKERQQALQRQSVTGNDGAPSVPTPVISG